MSELLEQRQPGLTDRPALIRLEAAISETQRLRSVTPVGIPHGTVQVRTTVRVSKTIVFSLMSEGVSVDNVLDILFVS